MLECGLIQVYTGDGKGKTTAAIGQALRASGRGLKCIIIQFMKKGDYGEKRAIEGVKNITLEQYGLSGFVIKGKERREDYEAAECGLSRVREIIRGNECDILILDELNVALHFGLLKSTDVLSILEEKPDRMEIIITGRCMPEEIGEIADLVTEMKMVKHPYEAGVQARKGIEF